MNSGSLFRLASVALFAVAPAAVASPKHHTAHARHQHAHAHADAHASHAGQAGHAGMTAHRAPSAPPISYFLGGNPHVPLAVAHGSLLRSAVSDTERGHSCGPRSRWRVPASRWNAIDAWGQLVGSYVVESFDDYDVTGCAEIAFVGAPRNDGALVFVSADSAWQPSPSLQWAPSGVQRQGFEAALADVVRGHAQSHLMRECTEIHEDTRFFEIAASHANGAVAQRFAVGGRNGGYVVASLGADGRWSRDLVKSEPVRAPDYTNCYKPVAVFDMNGDGVPEIVMRQSEPASWSDFVLMRSGTGHWQVVATSPGGSTA